MGAAVHGLIVSGAHSPHRCEDAELQEPVTVSPNAVSAYARDPTGTPSVGSPLSSRATSPPGLSVGWGLSSAHRASYSFPAPLAEPMTPHPPPHLLLLAWAPSKQKHTTAQQAVRRGGGRPQRLGRGKGSRRVWCPCRAQGKAHPVTVPTQPCTGGPHPSVKGEGKPTATCSARLQAGPSSATGACIYFSHQVHLFSPQANDTIIPQYPRSHPSLLLFSQTPTPTYYQILSMF